MPDLTIPAMSFRKETLMTSPRLPATLALCQLVCITVYTGLAVAQGSQPSNNPLDNGVVSVSLLLATIGFTGWLVWWFASALHNTKDKLSQLKAWQDGHDKYCEKRNRSLRVMHRKLNRSLGLPEDEGEELF